MKPERAMREKKRSAATAGSAPGARVPPAYEVTQLRYTQLRRKEGSRARTKRRLSSGKEAPKTLDHVFGLAPPETGHLCSAGAAEDRPPDRFREPIASAVRQRKTRRTPGQLS